MRLRERGTQTGLCSQTGRCVQAAGKALFLLVLLVKIFCFHFPSRCASGYFDGKRVVSGGSGFMANVWSVSMGQQLTAFTDPHHYMYYVAFFSDGKRAVSGSFDSKVHM